MVSVEVVQRGILFLIYLLVIDHCVAMRERPTLYILPANTHRDSLSQHLGPA